ncbi:MAG: hypothetical protein ABIT05_02020 [Chitinophagaceae bacterium]
MRILFLTIILVCLGGSVCLSQDNKEVNLTTLLEITEKGDFREIRQLILVLDYQVRDSIMSKHGALFYSARDRVDTGNIIHCKANRMMKIELLSFSTCSKDKYEDFKKQLASAGFISSGVYKGDRKIKVFKTNTIESEHFEKGSMQVDADTWTINDGPLIYAIYVMKF